MWRKGSSVVACGFLVSLAALGVRAAARPSAIGRASSAQQAEAFDARIKPWYPKEVTCDPGTAAAVTNRWKEYFPAGNVAMGDSERGHLD